MKAPPADPGQGAIEIRAKVKWKNEGGEIYLTGTVTTPERETCLVLELDDVSWTRSAAPGEVTYRLAIGQEAITPGSRSVSGDLTIDPKGREWRQSYVDSRELEKIKALARGKGFQGNKLDRPIEPTIHWRAA